MWRGKYFFMLLICFSVIALNIEENSRAQEEIMLNDDEVQFTFLSLPDGEALLISTGTDKKILINTGAKNSEDELLSQLKKLGVKKLDALIITSNKMDTCGNTDTIITEFEVERVISSSNHLCDPSLDYLPVETWEQGKLYELSSGLLFRVVKVKDSESMSLFILFGNNSLLFMDEASKEMEEMIMKFPSKVEIIKVPEYANKNYPSADLLTELDPHLAIIYNIKNNKLHDGLVERLTESWIDVYQLKSVGTVHIKCTPSDYELKK
jgi:competence protein ComEC